MSAKSIRGLLLDLDGVVHIGDQLIPGAIEAIEHLKSQKIPYRYTTNTTTRTRRAIAERLKSMGLDARPEEIISPPYAAVLRLRELGSPQCRLVIREDLKSEFGEFVRTDSAETIVIGDIGNRWDYDLMSSLFRQVMNGARIIALHKGKYWQEPDGLRLDIGAFITGLEYATGTKAEVIGKPSRAFFDLALSDLGIEAANTAMIGDDAESDIGGAQKAGLKGILVRTGKYRPESETASDVTPDTVIDSIADIKVIL